ncbi:hypothetical protein QN277_022113 [Acacia crassicarpa]|uniref:adenine phosphoribosyltransferase n=1 Tax=Acacia crassicarpa TaxID=499986 RepID=A0AAE1MLG8_9FABA|nr:hypothetical protein QN277_022113 [Acacia crassicarpa]
MCAHHHHDTEEDPRIEGIKSTIHIIRDFPKPGGDFLDVNTLLLNPKAFKDTIDLLVEQYKGKHISVVAGVEARGFIFGAPVALGIGAKFVALRKPNKLPGKVMRTEYSLEYGNDCLETQVGVIQAGELVVIVDDVLATGGTLCAAISLLERNGAQVVECACVFGVRQLKGRQRLNGLGKPSFVLVEI